jgi:hypothetical protein
LLYYYRNSYRCFTPDPTAAMKMNKAIKAKKLELKNELDSVRCSILEANEIQRLTFEHEKKVLKERFEQRKASLELEVSHARI